MPRMSVEERFWSKVDKSGECWEFQGSIARKGGYPRFSLGPGMSHSHNAHRAAWILTHGTDPGELYVCHHCDNPRCVRPDHLYLGTPADNTADMDNRGRRGHGWQRRKFDLREAARAVLEQAESVSLNRSEMVGVDPALLVALRAALDAADALDASSAAEVTR